MSQLFAPNAVTGISAESAIIIQDVKQRQDRTSLRIPAVECELLSIGLKVFPGSRQGRVHPIPLEVCHATLCSSSSPRFDCDLFLRRYLEARQRK
jgi:hypothetical protein